MIKRFFSSRVRGKVFNLILSGIFSLSFFTQVGARFIDVNTTRGLDNSVFFSAVPPRTRSVTALFPHVRLSDSLNGQLAVDFAYEQNEGLTPILKEVLNKEVTRHLVNLAIDIERIDPRVYDLISPFTAQERKLAAQFTYGGSDGAFVWHMQLPFIFVERNLWLPQDKQGELGNVTKEPVSTPTGGMNPSYVKEDNDSPSNLLSKQAKKFTYLAGPSNTILSAGLRGKLGDSVEGIFGVRGIIPTSVLAARQLLNESLNISLDEGNAPFLAKLFALYPGYRVIFNNIGKVIPKIRQIVLNPLDTVPPAWGSGVFFEGKTAFLEGQVAFWSRIDCDYYYPVTVDRLVLVNQPISVDLPNVFDTAIVPESLPLQLPLRVRARSSLGLAGNLVQGLTLCLNEKVSFSFGYDIHHQAGERLQVELTDEIKGLMNTLVRINPSAEPTAIVGPVALNVAAELSQKRRLTQHRVFSNFRADRFFSESTSLIIGGDYALSSGGMGASWALYTRAHLDF